MANVKNNTATQETRRRLLTAAGEVFAERGFHDATIKQITDRAGASLASVNYHFSDKAELYAAVIRQIGEKIVDRIPPDDQLTGTASVRFRQFIQWYCVQRARLHLAALGADPGGSRSDATDRRLRGTFATLHPAAL